MLSFGPTKACRHAISAFCTKHCEQLSAVSLTVNLLSRLFARVSSKCFMYSFYIVLGHHMEWWLMMLQNTSWLFQMPVPMHHRSVNQCCLVWVHLIKLTSNTGVGFQLCQPFYTNHFLSHENISSTEAKQDGTLVSNAICMHLHDLEQAGKKWELPH